ncbi:uncharacterized protein LOC143075932 [Mytilus galloprovincialis]|uniref:uncharacterized protein LOC143075932 n=1 Tax=Mytilus galloprovincialis TaxID=29158 RepID=UPI003F7BEC48
MCTTITMYIVSLCQFIAASDTSIKWDVKTKSVIYGKETSLTCNGQTCSPHSSKQWIGGPSYDLLCSEDYTANRNKYEMVVQSTSFYFDLMIKNFTFDDANCKYTCVCGLHQYTKMLELDSLEFIYPPYLEKDDIVTKESKVQVDILMQVFPLPTCVISYQESVMPLNISDYATTYEHGDYFKIFEVRIYQIYEIDHLSCKGSLNLSCTVGSHHYIPIETTINFCTEDKNDLKSIAVVVGIAVLCLSGFGIIAYGICKFVIRKFQHSIKEIPDVGDYNMTESTANANEEMEPIRCSTDRIDIGVTDNETHSLFQVDDNG